MKKIKAHFFWHGKLSLYEYACIASFVHHGFDVIVWSYENLKLPLGATNKNASEILSKDLLFQFEMPKGNVGSIAAFSDLFRLEVIKKCSGWWFDTDCICLKNVEEFFKLNNFQNVVAGWEDKKLINNAVISMTPELSEKCINKINLLSKENNNRFKWGQTGPGLITSVVEENNLFNEILPSSMFYPIHWKNALDVIDPEKTEEVEQKCVNSNVYHYWSEIFSRNNIDKSILPTKDTFLFKHFDYYIKTY